MITFKKGTFHLLDKMFLHLVKADEKGHYSVLWTMYGASIKNVFLDIDNALCPICSLTERINVNIADGSGETIYTI